MNRQLALAKLRELEPQLRQVGIASACLFGSMARGEAAPESDIDVAVTPKAGVTIDALTLLDLYGLLGDEFGYDRSVDLVVLPSQTESLNHAIAKEGLLAFA
jgi:hypothetical protein